MVKFMDLFFLSIKIKILKFKTNILILFSEFQHEIISQIIHIKRIKSKIQILNYFQNLNIIYSRLGNRFFFLGNKFN